MKITDLIFESLATTKEWQEIRDQRLLTAERECDLQYERLREMLNEDSKVELDFYLSTQIARAEHFARVSFEKGMRMAFEWMQEIKSNYKEGI